MFHKALVTASFLLLASCAAPSRAFVAPTLSTCGQADGTTPRLRVVSYNIRSGLSSSIEKVGDLLAGLDADVIALQEVDVGVRRTGKVDQAQVLADRLGMQHAFAGTIKREGGVYGIALLSRLPFTRAERVDLHAGGAFEPRAAIDASVCVNGREVRVVSVHADVFGWASKANSKMLAARLKPLMGQGIIVMGDLNATPKEEPTAEFTQAGLLDILHTTPERPTFRGSDKRIDYLLADQALDAELSDTGVIDSDVSDHDPVYADFAPHGG